MDKRFLLSCRQNPGEPFIMEIEESAFPHMSQGFLSNQQNALLLPRELEKVASAHLARSLTRSM